MEAWDRERFCELESYPDVCREGGMEALVSVGCKGVFLQTQYINKRDTVEPLKYNPGSEDTCGLFRSRLICD